MKINLGIDEAGRGCVIGPMVVAVVASDQADRQWFWKNKIRDSKIVPAEQRDRLAKMIKERCWFDVAIVYPPEIDLAVFNRSKTLNGLELELMSNLLKTSQEHFRDHETMALVDAPSINAQAFLEKLFMRSGWDAMSRLKAKHEADKRDRTVAAASIIAKAEREKLIKKLKDELEIDFGCGYPHDKSTRQFLKKCPKNASYIRWSWKTARAI